MPETFREQLRILHGGSGDRAVLLLHGLGATADVWRDTGALLDARGDVRWLAPDLPGHGGSAPLRRHSVGAMTAALSVLLDPTDQVSVLGHSLGGMLGLSLATGWYGVHVRRVVGVGIKVAWSDEERAGMAAQAQKPARSFATREQALARHLRVSGLDGLVGADDARLTAGVRADGDAWRLSLEQRAYELSPAPMARLLTAVDPRTSTLLARGEHDAMVSDADLADLAALAGEPVTLAGLGHNAHVEDPAAVLGLLDGGAAAG
jgi:pimeloyl-ACP methyl ester carboxylesterase